MPKKNKGSNSTTIGLVQMSCEQKPNTNLKKALDGIADAAKRGAQIVCLQELFRSQYFCQTEDIELFKLAETIPGPSTEAISKIAKQKKVVVIASLFEKRAAGVYHNTAVMPTISGLFFASGRIAALIGASCGLSFRITRVSPLSFVFSEYASIKIASTVRLTPAAGSITWG